MNPEVVSVLRRLERAGRLSPARAAHAVRDLEAAPFRSIPTGGLVGIAWSLRANVSAYDAFHVALAQTLDCPLVTGDLRLAGAPGLGVPVVTA